MTKPNADQDSGAWRRWVSGMSFWLHGLLLLAAVGFVGFGTVHFLRQAAQREPVRLPDTMEEVDWTSPESSQYCLACHRQVGRAVPGLDVVHGHPQNVTLSAAQLQAVRELGTIVGPGDTLICMTCHKLGVTPDNPYMLADSLQDSELCSRCHPGHFVVGGAAHDFRLTSPGTGNRLNQTPETGGPCSACHVAHSFARDFTPCAVDPNGQCVSCHEMNRCSGDLTQMMRDHPESHCVECHNPHDNRFGYFLQQPITELCLDCHGSFAGGNEAGMHVLGEMEEPIPQALIDAGAKTGNHPSELTCLVCHSTHTANHQPLLIYPPQRDDVCLPCHEAKLAARSPDGQLPRHGQQPGLNAEQQAVVRRWRGRMGSGGELRCVSCHLVHNANPDTLLLAFNPRQDDTCTACHPEKAEMLGTSHDLRTNFPDEPNLLGVTPLQGGACSACHFAHGFARQRVPGPGDPSGVCTTCHTQGQCGQQILTAEVTHPGTSCVDCHDPHERSHRNYLAAAPADLCVQCHQSEAALAGGPHDITRTPDKWPEGAREQPGLCLPCHQPHSDVRNDLLRLGSPGMDSYHDAVCLSCHPSTSWGADTDVAVIHPHEISPDQRRVDVALVPQDAQGNQRMGCRTCHNPHGGANPVHLARVEPDEPTIDLCLRCHEQKTFIKYTGHAPESLANLGFDVDSCKPCHAMHANPAASRELMLSPRFLQERCAELQGVDASCVPCLACHHDGGPAPVRRIYTHPPVEMTNIISPEVEGYMPLFNADGAKDPRGQITCRTCHLSHGQIDLLKFVAGREQLSEEELHAMRLQLREFRPPNICTECHGEDGRRKFLFFHDPERRG